MVHYDNLINAEIILVLSIHLKHSLQILCMMCLDIMTTALLQSYDFISRHKRLTGYINNIGPSRWLF